MPCRGYRLSLHGEYGAINSDGQRRLHRQAVVMPIRTWPDARYGQPSVALPAGGVECIETNQGGYRLAVHQYLWGNAMKYLWRFPQGSAVQDLMKCKWYIDG
ncbi:MAG: DUF3310 domain-containing protein [Eggerthella lenta]